MKDRSSPLQQPDELVADSVGGQREQAEAGGIVALRGP